MTRILASYDAWGRPWTTDPDERADDETGIMHVPTWATPRREEDRRAWH